MVRRRRRRLNYDFNQRYFKPRGIPLSSLEEVKITDEELETLRLRYIEKMTQEDAANKMKISQSQYQRDLTQALESITEALIKGKAIYVEKLNKFLNNKNMKVLIPMDSKSETDQISDVFGRSKFFAIYDSEKLSFVENPGNKESRGAGMTAAQFAIDQEITKVITGNVGPNAKNVLEQGGIKVEVTDTNKTAKEIIEQI